MYFQKKLETIKYNVALAITGAIRWTSRENLFWASFRKLQDRRWYKKLCIFYKILNKMTPKYLSVIIPKHYTKEDILQEIRTIFL